MWRCNVFRHILPLTEISPKRNVVSTKLSKLKVCGRNYSVSKVKFTQKTPKNEGEALARSQKSKSPNIDVPPGGWVLLVIPVSTLGLGIWQVYRWRWKLGLIEQMRLKSIAEPVDLPEDYSQLEQLEYCRVKLRGRFDYSKEVIMGPRALVSYDEHERLNRGVFSSSSTNNGYLIITPFILEGQKEAILVNRGWIDSKNLKKYRHVDGTVEIVGIVRKAEQRQPFMSKTRAGQNMFLYRDVPVMAQMLDTQEVFLDLYSIEGVDFKHARKESIPVPRQTRVTLRNEHVSYFVTWFSLSSITFWMWHRRFIRGLHLL